MPAWGDISDQEKVERLRNKLHELDEKLKQMEHVLPEIGQTVKEIEESRRKPN